VVERLGGSATTDFGAPGSIAQAEDEPPGATEAERLVRLLGACWAHLDRVAEMAPAVLRKGPRGGGRDRDAIVEHVLRAEAEAYAPKLGLRLPGRDPGELQAREAHRTAIAEALRGPAPAPPARGKLWPARYAARRIAWHVLDHAWEVEDRSG
jgi:hypothetical protein